MSARSPRDEASVRALLDRIREDASITRRDYLRILVTVSGGLVVGSVAIAAGVFRRHGIATAPARRVLRGLRPGQAAYFNYPRPDDQAIAIGLPGGRVVGYSAICTHLACSVLWRPERGRLECPCHNGVFDPTTGEVLAGPPPRPLPRVLLETRSDGIYATGTSEE